MEKLGVEKSELKKELQEEYNKLIGQKLTGAMLSKEASASQDEKIEAVRARINELGAD